MVGTRADRGVAVGNWNLAIRVTSVRIWVLLLLVGAIGLHAVPASAGSATDSLTDQLAAAERQRPLRSLAVDQVNDPPWTGSWTNIQTENAASQTFVPSKARLVGVEVALLTANPEAIGHGVTVTILDSDGVPLASASRRLASGFEGWLFFRLGRQGIGVVPGDTYTLQVTGDGCCLFGWKYSSGDTYPSGERIFFGNPEEGTDWLFRTYGP